MDDHLVKPVEILTRMKKLDQRLPTSTENIAALDRSALAAVSGGRLGVDSGYPMGWWWHVGTLLPVAGIAVFGSAPIA